MNSLFPWPLVCCLVLFGATCAPGGRDVRDYYFPALDLQGGKVYVYDLPSGDSSAPEYWYFRGFVRDSGIFLSSTNYDQTFEIRQITREKLVKNGALLRDYFLYEPDSTRSTLVQVPATVSSPNLFPFQVTDSLGVFLFSLSYSPPSTPGATIYLIRNRRFLGDGPDFTFDGKSYSTIRFGLREAVGYEQEGAAEIAGVGEEWYARGLGLVYRSMHYGSDSGFDKTFQLREIISMQELEARAKHVLTKDRSETPQ